MDLLAQGPQSCFHACYVVAELLIEADCLLFQISDEDFFFPFLFFYSFSIHIRDGIYIG